MVVTLLEVSDREGALTVHLPRPEYQDANPVTISPFANDLITLLLSVVIVTPLSGLQAMVRRIGTFWGVGEGRGWRRKGHRWVTSTSGPLNK